MEQEASAIDVDNSVAHLDPVWSEVRRQSEQIIDTDPGMARFIMASVLHHSCLEEAVAYIIASRLDHPDLPANLLRAAFRDAIDSAPEIGESIRVDLAAVLDRDPACHRLVDPLLYFKGFHAIQSHRFAHALWQSKRYDMAYYIQSQVSRVWSVDIHPLVPIGKGIMLDHGHSLVVGETARIGDNVSILQGVTLGGTGKDAGDRHPKIGDCVLIGAGAKVLGNIQIGHCSRIAAGSVVLKSIPPNSTVVGVPARIVGHADCPEPSRTMNQMLELDTDE